MVSKGDGMKLRRGAAALLVLVVGACSESYDAQTVLVSTVEGDLPRLASNLDLVTGAAGRLALGGTEYSTRGGGVGDCRWDIEARGRPLEGQLRSSLETAPCGGPIGPGGVFDLSMDEGSLSGEWDGTALGEVWMVAVSHRLATVHDGPRSYDASYRIPALELTLEDGGVRSWKATMAYDAFAGTPWRLDVAVRDGVFDEGLLASTEGSCVVSGAVASPRIDCDG